MREKKDTCRRWFRYTVEDTKAAQAELDRLADGGWELAELGIFTALFRRAEAPRRCWVEPARWKSIRRKDEQARADYLMLCDEAGWELIDEAAGLFYFQAKPGEQPAPIQTDESVEWEQVLKKALWDQTSSLFFPLLYFGAWTLGSFFRDRPRMWELFFSSLSMLLLLWLVVWLAVDILLGARVVRYRRKCRRAAEAGEPIPVPRRWMARFRGTMPIFYTVLGLLIAGTLLNGMGGPGALSLDAGWLETGHSFLGDRMQYRSFSPTGDVWVEEYDCKTDWLAGLVCGSLQAEEQDEKTLDLRFHRHNVVELEEAQLGYDQAWRYHWAEGGGLIFRQGDRVVRIEATQMDLDDRVAVDDLLAELNQTACAWEESMTA